MSVSDLKFQPPYEGRKTAPWVKALVGKSGVYIIRKPGILGKVLYVGESHTGRLKKTLLRHFQHWKGKTKGPTYPKTLVEVAIIRPSAKNAVEIQNAMIVELMPQDNEAEKPSWLERFFS